MTESMSGLETTTAARTQQLRAALGVMREWVRKTEATAAAAAERVYAVRPSSLLWPGVQSSVSSHAHAAAAAAAASPPAVDARRCEEELGELLKDLSVSLNKDTTATADKEKAARKEARRSRRALHV